jgi:site-specific DNA-methyltransferase (adenine-specific)
MATKQRIIPGDCIAGLRTLPDASVHCCVTSPPYWGLRDYGHDGQIGLEATPDAYVARMVEVFREVRRVLLDDGTCWVNLGDSYAAGGLSRHGYDEERRKTTENLVGTIPPQGRAPTPPGLKPKDLVGIPWRVAFALQADGWWLRQDIIWAKPNPMPESVRDRCTKAHEYVFLLTKSERYFYDAEAVSEKSVGRERFGNWIKGQPCPDRQDNHRQDMAPTTTRNRRSVWTITTKPYSGAHFAVMPADLVEPCIKAGCPEGGTVLDPFAGSGTTLAVAAELGRNAIGCELNPDYIELAERRILDARQSVALFEAIP